MGRMTRAQIARARQRRLREEAAAAWYVGTRIVEPFFYNDGSLVHHVYRAKYRFNNQHNGPGGWSDYDVWATICERILSVEHVHFTKTKKAVSCLECLGSL
jgi:hypothetical protein